MNYPYITGTSLVFVADDSRLGKTNFQLLYAIFLLDELRKGGDRLLIFDAEKVYCFSRSYEPT